MERDRPWLISPWMNKCLSADEVSKIYDHYHVLRDRGEMPRESKYLCYFVQDHYPEIYVRMRIIARLHGAEL